MVDTPAAVATNLNAPVDERYDAQVAAQRVGLGDLIPASDVQVVINHIESQWEEQRMAKAMSRDTNIVQFPGARRSASQRGGQSVFLDDFQIQTQGEYWDRPGALNFDSMKAMVEQTPILNGIVLTRIRQVNRFCRPAGKDGIGFSIEHTDPTVKLNDEQQKSTQLLAQFITNCGWETDPRRRKRLKRDNFSQFMAKSVRDTLTMDACPIETEFKRDRALGLDGFYALDGASIRLCTEEGYEGDDEVFALQVIQGRIRTAYTYDELVYEVRNPRTDVTACGYGYAETEMLIKVITYLLNTFTYNGGFFDKNSIPRGILNLIGNYDQADLAAMKRYMNAMVRGVQNAHNMPIMVAKDAGSKAEFVEIGGQMSELAFGSWITLLTSVSCAIYGIAPEEISMDSFSSSKSALSGSDTEEKLVSSSDKGLRPLLGFYEGVFSDFLIQTFSPNYTFRFKGLDSEDQGQRFERQKLSTTWDEMRALDGMDPIGGEMGGAPMNPSLITVWQASTGIGQPTEDFGDPDAEGAADESAPGGLSGAPEAGDDAAEGDAPGGAADFGAPPAGADDGGKPFGKSLTAADFGLPPIYAIEA
jgi:hypothetical protein